MPMIALAAALVISGQATTPPPQRAGSNLTRDLNSAPPSATPPAASTAAPTQALARLLAAAHTRVPHVTPDTPDTTA